MSNTVVGQTNHISMMVRLSRKSYFPGAIVSGVMTLEPTSEDSQGEYISIITIQLHGYIGVNSSLATLPKELKRDKKHINTIAYGNVSKFINDSTDCIYQTNPILLDSDITFKSRKAYFFQMQLPSSIPPTMKTSCVRYFHLLSFSFSQTDPTPHTISIPITVVTYPFDLHVQFFNVTPSSYSSEDIYSFSINPMPIGTESYYTDITDEYNNNDAITISEEVKEEHLPSENSLPLEFNHLYKINVDESILDDIWSRAKYYTSYNDYLDANPASPIPPDEADITFKHRHQYNIFSITHKGNTVANIQLCTSPIIMGDIFQITADFTDTHYSCEQMVISLFMEEYSPYLKDRGVKSTLVTSNSMITKNLKKYPFSFSIPATYPPSFASAQVKIVWKLKFTFSVSAKSTVAEGEYVFDPEAFISQSFSKVHWSYDLQVRSCVNEHFNDVIGERCELNGIEESFIFLRVCKKEWK